MVADLVAAWSKAYEQVAPAKNEILMRGTMSNIISQCFKAGYDLSTLNCLTDFHGATWVMSGAQVSLGILVAAITRLFFR